MIVQGNRYIVKPNDSLWSIAQSQLGAGVLWPRIFVYNTRPEVTAVTHTRLKSPNLLQIGQTLLIPLPDRINPRGTPGTHPAQITRPAPTANTAKAGTTQAAPKPAASVPGVQASSDSTRVNSFPFKYTLDQLPPIKLESGAAEIEIKFAGSVTIWADEQIPILTYTNKGAEIAAKQETDGALAKLLSDTQVSWDSKSNKVEFEDMLTINAKGAPPSLNSIGVAMSSEDGMPVIRAKFKSPELKGKYLKFLYVSPELTITIDIKLKPDDPKITRQAQPVSEPAWYAGSVHFVAKYGLYIAGGALATAVVVSNFVTLGADTPVDIPAPAAVTGIFAAAAAR
jgi:hypothetical protein